MYLGTFKISQIIIIALFNNKFKFYLKKNFYKFIIIKKSYIFTIKKTSCIYIKQHYIRRYLFKKIIMCRLVR